MTTAAALWREGAAEAALALAWKDYDAAPGSRAASVLLARILRENPTLAVAEREAALCALLTNPDVDPAAVSEAGWLLALRGDVLSQDSGFEAMARRVEGSALVLTLLREDIVTVLAAETALTALRRWLLLGGRWSAFPKTAAALIAQAGMNGGAWLFDDKERARFAGDDGIAPAFRRAAQGRPRDFADATTRAVAEQYEAWPYPMWHRVMAGDPLTLAQEVRERDPGGPEAIAEPGEILIAGCGTGRQAAIRARRAPHDKITAIDLSEASLDYARTRCAELGLHGIAFRSLDLHEAGSLGRKFDVVECTGVLHHLPDPEKGWAALAGVLKPGGAMHIMVYSRIARLRVAARRRYLSDLESRPIDDDVLREARRRMMALPAAAMPRGREFSALAHVHDLLLHRHEDPFDIARIRRGLDALGLRLIRFELPRQRDRVAYRAANPQDPLQRDFDAWSAFERDRPTVFAGMYDFWCRKPL